MSHDFLTQLDHALIPAESPLAGLESFVDPLRECGRLFHARGWSVGTSSNYSAVIRRDPLELVITASGKDKGRLQRTDFVRVDRAGRPTPPKQLKSSAETLLHTSIVDALPNVGAVLHTHSIWGTLLSDVYFKSGGFEIADYEMLKGLAGVATHEHRELVLIFDNTQDMPALAEKVRPRLTETRAAPLHGYLIRKHGLYTWGRDVEEARRHVEIFEFLFECVARRLHFTATSPVAW